MRLGFAVKVLGRDLKSNDARRWQSSPHLRVSIEYAHAIFDYLQETGVSMYRLSSDFAPYLTHPDLPQFHHQLEEARDELVALGRRARDMNLRLSFHPSQYIVLNSPSERLTEVSTRDFLAQATMLDMMECGPEAVIVTHVGGVYGEREVAMQRFIDNFHKLPEPAKRRLALENDDVSWNAADVLKIHEATGIQCIFDHQHHHCIETAGQSAVDACSAILKTWPQGCRPKIHFSSPRQEQRVILRRSKETGKLVQHEANPLASQHADFIDADVFLDFARAVAARMGNAPGEIPFDVMCEAKAKDFALFHLREDLKRMAPDIIFDPAPSDEQRTNATRIEAEKERAEREVIEAKEARVRLASERKIAKEKAAKAKARMDKKKAKEKAAKEPLKGQAKAEREEKLQAKAEVVAS